MVAPQLIVGAIITDAVVQWFTTLFEHSVRSGDLKDVADQVFHIPAKMLEGGLVKKASNPGLVSNMLVARAEWATRYRREKAREASLHLVAALNSRTLSLEDEAQIDLFLPADPRLAEFQLVH